MRIFFVSIALLLLNSMLVKSQSQYCADSDPFCTGTTYIFPAGVNTGSAEPGANYGCLSTQPNPAWYHMKILEPGSISIQMFSTPLRDIDFILWGPFIDPVTPCVAGLTANKIVSCSYSPNPIETANIPNGQVGEYYILLITNFSNQPCNITFEKIGGTGETDCTIIPPPIGSNSPVCYGNSIELHADNYPGATFSWTGPNGYSSSLQNPVILNATMEHAGTYSLVITAGGNSSDPINTEVNVFANPQPAFDYTEVCFGVPNSFTDQSTVNPPEYSITSRLWQFGDGNTSNQTNPEHTFGSPGVYNVSLTTYTANMQCGTTVTHEIEVFGMPTADAGDNQEIPNGWTTQLEGNINGGSGNYDIAWEPAALLENPTAINPTTVSLSQTVVFTLTATDQVSGCQHSDEVMVNVTGGALYVDALANPLEICQGQQIQLNAITSGGAGSYSYSWQSNPAGFSANISNPVDSPMQTTTYTVAVFDGQNTVSNQVTLVVNPKPTVNAGDNITINAGTATQLQGIVSSGTPTYNYLWFPADSLQTPGDAFLSNPTTKNLHAPTQFTFSVTDSKGCQSETDQVYVFTEGDFLTVFPEASQTVICFGQSTTLSATAVGGSGEYSFEWTANNSAWTENGQQVTVSPQVHTVYTVTVFDGFKYVPNNISVLVNPLPLVDVLPDGMSYSGLDTITVCVRDSVLLDAGPDMNYLWSNNSSSRVQRATTNGNYLDWQTWSVIVTNPVTGCVNYDTITIFFDFTSCNIGVDETALPHYKINVHPNPSAGIFKLTVDDFVGEIELLVTNLHGQAVLPVQRQTISNSNRMQQIDLSGFPEGVYYLQVSSRVGKVVYKLIKNLNH